ncbi:response regulator [Arachnia propionica]|jgi:regulatory protein, luxR:response regulator receiver|uniref:Response regulator protein vraR n=1 Tax=Arachnia propionica TaxID=1750 RepID=A0A3N4D895_9ACTN|nr:response regulator transcription factor [Arachnia propionica]AFN45599.1 response regulator receiver domain protein [Arachnia propionica F0230a]QCT39461.1 response regulator transcription factor [Arachnia propionica]QUC12561.1 response regulator transcription factor [Arachnia propionica]QUC15732.1 response regulator transcription factor [Arachnia propionica]RPA18266.1 DNA-binding response regulator [Arachnia propionica]
MVRVVLIDDDPLVRAGLKLMLGGREGVDFVGEGSDGSEAAALVAEHRPDVLLMDIRMPGKDGLTATEELMAQKDAPRVVILTTFDSDDSVLRALAAGAAGFLLKDTPPDRMLEAIKQVAAGEHTLSPSVVSQVIAAATRHRGDPRREDARADLAVLNAREKDVAIAIGRGLTNAEISARHYLSLATVKGVVTQIFDKLGLTNRVQVAIKVHDAGWADD